MKSARYKQHKVRRLFWRWMRRRSFRPSLVITVARHAGRRAMMAGGVVALSSLTACEHKPRHISGRSMGRAVLDWFMLCLCLCSFLVIHFHCLVGKVGGGVGNEGMDLRFFFVKLCFFLNLEVDVRVCLPVSFVWLLHLTCICVYLDDISFARRGMLWMGL